MSVNDAPKTRQEPPAAPPPPKLKPEKPVNLRRDAQMLIVVVGAFIAMIVAGAVYASRGDDGHSAPNIEPDHTKHFAYVGGIHTEDPVTYAEVPPVGGPYPANQWQACGFYPGYVKSELAVHSMSHGAVWITYSPDLPADEIEKLKEIAAENEYVLISMYDGLPNPVIASAWNHQLDFKVVGDPDLELFVAVLQNGHETQEPGEPCAGGVTDMITPTAAATPAAT